MFKNSIWNWKPGNESRQLRECKQLIITQLTITFHEGDFISQLATMFRIRSLFFA